MDEPPATERIARRIARRDREINARRDKHRARIVRLNTRNLKDMLKLVDARTGDHVYVVEAGDASVPYANYQCTRHLVTATVCVISENDSQFSVDTVDVIDARVVGTAGVDRMGLCDAQGQASDATGKIVEFIMNKDVYSLTHHKCAELQDISARGEIGVRHIYCLRDMLVDVWQQVHLPPSDLHSGKWQVAMIPPTANTWHFLIYACRWKDAGIPMPGPDKT